jgi:UDP-N-acetylglucosamine 2-epimerase
MPEEINRLVADHCGDRLYAPTPTAMKNLADEHLADRAVQSGDVMRDAVFHNRQLAREKSRALETLQLEPGQYGLLTIHRPINTTAESLEKILGALESQAAATLPLIFPVHPRTRPLVGELGYDSSSALRVIEPAAYLDMLQLLEGAAVVVTDSGGVQKEAAFLSTPCITLREETEWTETIDMGVNRLVGQDVAAINDAFSKIFELGSVFDKTVAKELDRCYGNGASAGLIASDLVSWCAAAQAR